MGGGVGDGEHHDHQQQLHLYLLTSCMTISSMSLGNYLYTSNVSMWEVPLQMAIVRSQDGGWKKQHRHHCRQTNTPRFSCNPATPCYKCFLKFLAVSEALHLSSLRGNFQLGRITRTAIGITGHFTLLAALIVTCSYPAGHRSTSASACIVCCRRTVRCWARGLADVFYRFLAGSSGRDIGMLEG